MKVKTIAYITECICFTQSLDNETVATVYRNLDYETEITVQPITKGQGE